MANGRIRCQKRRPWKRFHKLILWPITTLGTCGDNTAKIRSHLELIGKGYEKEISVALRGLILFERDVSASR